MLGKGSVTNAEKSRPSFSSHRPVARTIASSPSRSLTRRTCHRLSAPFVNLISRDKVKCRVRSTFSFVSIETITGESVSTRARERRNSRLLINADAICACVRAGKNRKGTVDDTEERTVRLSAALDAAGPTTALPAICVLLNVGFCRARLKLSFLDQSKEEAGIL